MAVRRVRRKWRSIHPCTGCGERERKESALSPEECEEIGVSNAACTRCGKHEPIGTLQLRVIEGGKR